MKITGLRLRTFGPHVKLYLKTDYPLIGILGPNGCGKSNLLQAVRFVLRGKAGDTDEKLSSFIYNGGDGGKPAKSASVEADIVKDGNVGLLKRTITKTSSTRSLTWMGRTVTKDAEVKALLADVLGVDEYVLDSAVFIPQGQLDKLLFGKPTEREDMFVKMMLLGFMAKVSDAAEQRAQMLARTIQDQTILKDEVLGQQREAETQLAAIEQTFKKCPNVSDSITQWEGIIDKSNRIQQHIAEMHEAQDTIKRLKAASTTLFAGLKLKGVSDAESFRRYYVYAQDCYSSALTALEGQRRGKAIKDKLDTLNATIDRHKSTVDMIAKAGVTTSTVIPDEAVTAKEAELTEMREKLEVVNKVGALTTFIKSCADSVAARGPELDLLRKSHIDKALEERNLTGEWRDLKVKIATLKPIMASSEITTSHCPLCEQKFSKSLSDLQDMLKTAEEAFEVKNNTLTNLRNDIGSIGSRINNLTSEIAAYQQNQKNAEQEKADKEELLAGYDNPPTQGDVDRIQKEVDEVRTAVNTIRQHKHRLMLVLQELASAESVLKGIAEEDTRLAEAYSDKALNAAEQEVAKLKVELDELTGHNTTIIKISTELEAASRTSTDQDNKQKAIRASLDDIKLTSMNSNLHAKYDAENVGAEKETIRTLVLGELQTKQAEHNEVKGQLDAIKKHADKTVKRLREIEAKEEMNVAAQKVVDELRSIKDSFSRKGIPRAFIAFHYDKLVALAQLSLAAMEANFNIFTHPDKPVTLQFVRNDKPGGAVFDQNKLSGGQKVRVSMAFLLAIQRMLVPELGFLCLDEPSTHIHDEGVEALRDMLSKLASQMNNSEAQMWISDHNKTLESAFGKTIRLNEQS